MARSFPFGGTGPPSKPQRSKKVNRLLVVPDVALKLQRARLLLCRGHKLWYQRRELVHLIDGNGEHPVHLFAPHPCLHGTAPQSSHDDDNRRNCQPLELRKQFFAWANVTFK
jgi:hypothetical protein